MPGELVDHATLSGLLKYWERKRGTRKMPARSDIDPIEMDRRILPHLMLCEISGHGDDIRFRLVGTSLVKRLGFDPTGQSVDELPPGDYADFLAALLRRAYAEATPVYGESVFCWGTKSQLDAKHLVLPLSAGGREPALLLAGMVYSCDDVFPPQIRFLNGMARHQILRRDVPTSSIDEDGPLRRSASGG